MNYEGCDLTFYTDGTADVFTPAGKQYTLNRADALDAYNYCKAIGEQYIYTERFNPPDAWHCICGNTPDGSGFHSTNSNNEVVEPTTEQWDTLSYGCMSCGRIIDNRLIIVANVNAADLQQQFERIYNGN